MYELLPTHSGPVPLTCSFCLTQLGDPPVRGEVASDVRAFVEDRVEMHAAKQTEVPCLIGFVCWSCRYLRGGTTFRPSCAPFA